MLKNLKPIFIENSKLPAILSYLAPITIGAITLFPFVFARGEISKTTRTHETIHFQQQIETFKGLVKLSVGSNIFLPLYKPDIILITQLPYILCLF